MSADVKAALEERLISISEERDLLLEKIEELETHVRALVKAWDENEIGQVDGELIENLARLVGAER